MNRRRALAAAGALGVGAGLAFAQAPAVTPAVKIGDMAPEFELAGTDGKRYKLSDYRGKQTVVLAFFPAAFTGG